VVARDEPLVGHRPAVREPLGQLSFDPGSVRSGAPRDGLAQCDANVLQRVRIDEFRFGTEPESSG
jgi:hypothetical protein